MSRSSIQNNTVYRFFSVIAIAVLALFISCISVFAEEADSISYSINGSELVISGSGAMKDYTPSNPAPWSEYKGSVTSVVIEEGVTSIGNMAFFSFAKMGVITLPSTLTSIGDSAFYNCSSLTCATLPQGVESIGEYAFEKCSMLVNVSPLYVNVVSEGAFSGCTSLNEVDLVKAGFVESYAFENCIALEIVKFSTDLKRIGYGAFAGAGVTTIEYQGIKGEFDAVEIEDKNECIITSYKNWHYGEHDFSNAKEIVLPTCTLDGYTLYICSCGETLKGDVISSEGHTYINYVARDEADSHNAEISYCTSCGDCIYKLVEDDTGEEWYTVTWVINNITFTEKYRKGQIPGCNFTNMEYVEKNGAKYLFEGFSPEITAVVEDVTYTASFTPIDGIYFSGDGIRYYVSGEMMTGWQTFDGAKYYFIKSTGIMVCGVKTIGGTEYRFGEDGKLYDGWYTDDAGTKYYKDGISQKSWQIIQGKTYYFYQATGLMVESESAVIGGFIREFNSDHSVKPISGWQIINNKVCYYRGGTIQTGWQIIDDKKYYFFRSDDKYGAMAWGWQSIGGKLYYFYSYKGTPGNGGDLFADSGNIGGVYYNISSEGYVVLRGLYQDSNGIRYFDQTCTYLTNTFFIVAGDKYYFGNDGYAYRSCVAEIDGIKYTFDENGVCIG